MQETITLGGGCFWCLDTAFRNLRGVLSVQAGYAGGETQDPTYKEVCSGSTGHAEVVQITFDSDQISLHNILEVFFALHDPTTLNRQGADVGSQYRSVIFYQTEDQQTQAEQFIDELSASVLWADPIVTELGPLTDYYPAETYHQDYFNQNPNQQYCQVVISPKLKNLQEKFHALLS